MPVTNDQRVARYKVARNILSQGLSSDPSRLIIVVGAGVSRASDGAPDWTTLIRECCDFASSVLPPDFVAGVRRLADGGSLVEAADKLRKNLPAGDFGYFLEDQFDLRPLPAANPTLYDILDGLREKGARLTTTNYDLIMERMLKLAQMEWTSPDLQRFFDCPKNRVSTINRRVLHIHGLYTRPENVIFASPDYRRIAANPEQEIEVERLQFFLRNAFTTANILFVGCGDTATDPHLSNLFDFGRRMQAGANLRHVHLCTDEVFERLGLTTNTIPSSVYLLPYGGYDDLGSAMRQLFPDVFNSTDGQH